MVLHEKGINFDVHEVDLGNKSEEFLSVRPKSERGSDDPRNGLVLCASHHRAFEVGLFAIEPSSLRIHTNTRGPDADSLRINHATLDHLPKKPHAEALQWLWAKWQ